VELLATISHELRNPLNAILGWASVLSRKPDLPAPVMHGLQAIERNSRLQAQLISDLLDYAGITFGNVRLATETIDPYPVVRAALEAVKTLPHSPPASRFAPPLTRSRCASKRMRRDCSRLYGTCSATPSSFRPEGSEVQLAAGRSGDSFSLVVSDNGIGIEADFLPRIFERFSQQHDTTTRSHGGSGLGMAIVKQLAELHGGSIHASSAGKGLGAKFTLKIPLRPPSR
jgi:signal transduction histidine kinase